MGLSKKDFEFSYDEDSNRLYMQHLPSDTELELEVRDYMVSDWDVPEDFSEVWEEVEDIANDYLGDIEYSANKESKMEKKSDYQGWSNYETWATALWFNNDRGLYEMVVEWAEEVLADNDATSDKDSYSSASVVLSDRIKDFVEEENPLDGDASVYADLLTGAISEVNFREVAEEFIGKAKEQKEHAEKNAVKKKAESNSYYVIKDSEVLLTEENFGLSESGTSAEFESIEEANEYISTLDPYGDYEVVDEDGLYMLLKTDSVGLSTYQDAERIDAETIPNDIRKELDGLDVDFDRDNYWIADVVDDDNDKRYEIVYSVPKIAIDIANKMHDADYGVIEWENPAYFVQDI